MALINTTFKSIALSRNVSFTAVLPVDNMDYLNERNRSLKGPYKTLYLLNGLYGDCTEWLTHTDIKRIAERNNLAVIMPSGENSFYRNHIEDNRLFSTYIGVELVDITRDMFNLSNKKEDTFIGGYSMGGYGALYNGFKYNNRFSKIIALSPALILENKFDKDNKSSFKYNQNFFEWCFGSSQNIVKTEANPEVLLNNLIDNNEFIPDIYLACGEDDDLIGSCRKFKGFLDDSHIDFRYNEGKGGHEWDYWNGLMDDIIKWLNIEYK